MNLFIVLITLFSFYSYGFEFEGIEFSFDGKEVSLSAKAKTAKLEGLSAKLIEDQIIFSRDSKQIHNIPIYKLCKTESGYEKWSFYRMPDNTLGGVIGEHVEFVDKKTVRIYQNSSACGFITIGGESYILNSRVKGGVT
jgi:hypothetical protein